MPRSRGTEMPQKQSPRAPLHLKSTASSEANGVHRSSPKFDDRRSPRSPLHEKKKMAELESKLNQAHEELKKLKEQLASAEAAKLDAQRQLEETKNAGPDAKEAEVETPMLIPQATAEPEEENNDTTDVFEVISESSVPTEPVSEQRDHETKDDNDAEKELEKTKPMISENGTENRELSELGAKLAEMEKVVECLTAENDSLKAQITDLAAAHAKEEELGEKLSSMSEELNEIRGKAEKLKQMLEIAEKGKATLEVEMKTLKVQMEQWRKAAETAAAVLADDDAMRVDMHGRRVAERCGSMEKHFGGYVTGMESPVMTGEDDEGYGGRRRSGGGMRMFGDLWRKKSHNK